MLSETSFPTYIITQEPGMVPKKKGPFYSTKMVEEFLREAYTLNPQIICIVIDMQTADASWYPEHGHAWLDIYGDRRRRHPRKESPSSPTKTEAVDADAVIERLTKALKGLRSYFLNHGWDEDSLMIDGIDTALKSGRSQP